MKHPNERRILQHKNTILNKAKGLYVVQRVNTIITSAHLSSNPVSGLKHNSLPNASGSYQGQS